MANPRTIPAGEGVGGRTDLPEVGLSTAAGWLALTLLTQCGALYLIDAGNTLRYQHYRVGANIRSVDAWLWGAILVQLLVVVWVLHRRLHWSGVPLPRALKTRIALAIFGLWSISAIISRNIWIYPIELTAAAIIEIVVLSTVVLGVGALPSVGSYVSRWGRALKEADPPVLQQPTRSPLSVVAAALIVGIAAAVLSVFAYQRHPHVPDEVIYLIHAKYFADGRLSMPLPPAAHAFDLDLMHYDATRWFSPVPPGWPAILAVGAFFGAPWLVNPLLCALNVWLAWKFLARIYAEPVARLASLLLAASPWHLFLGMSFMTHTATLTCALVAALAMANAYNSGRRAWLMVSGLAAGLVSVIRPLEGLAVALVLGPLSLIAGARRMDLFRGIAFGSAFGIAAALVLPYNAALTGDPFTFPIMAYADKYYWPNANALGFGPDRGLGWEIDPRPGHTPLEAIVNTMVNFSQVNTELLGWAAGSSIGVLALLAVGRLQRTDLVMMSVIAVVVMLHAFYWYTGGPDFGARYWFLIIVPMLALTARGVQELERLFLPREYDGRVVLGAVVLSVFALLTFVPWRAVDKYWHFRKMRPDIRELAEKYEFGRSLVLIRGNRFDDYASAAVYNPTDIASANGAIYAWDRNEGARREALRAFPDRQVWVVEGPSLTGRGFEVVSGPNVQAPGP